MKGAEKIIDPGVAQLCYRPLQPRSGCLRTAHADTVGSNASPRIMPPVGEKARKTT